MKDKPTKKKEEYGCDTDEKPLFEWSQVENKIKDFQIAIKYERAEAILQKLQTNDVKIINCKITDNSEILVNHNNSNSLIFLDCTFQKEVLLDFVCISGKNLKGSACFYNCLFEDEVFIESNTIKIKELIESVDSNIEPWYPTEKRVSTTSLYFESCYFSKRFVISPEALAKKNKEEWKESNSLEFLEDISIVDSHFDNSLVCNSAERAFHTFFVKNTTILGSLLFNALKVVALIALEKCTIHKQTNIVNQYCQGGLNIEESKFLNGAKIENSCFFKYLYIDNCKFTDHTLSINNTFTDDISLTDIKGDELELVLPGTSFIEFHELHKERLQEVLLKPGINMGDEDFMSLVEGEIQVSCRTRLLQGLSTSLQQLNDSATLDTEKNEAHLEELDLVLKKFNFPKLDPQNSTTPLNSIEPKTIKIYRALFNIYNYTSNIIAKDSTYQEIVNSDSLSYMKQMDSCCIVLFSASFKQIVIEPRKHQFWYRTEFNLDLYSSNKISDLAHKRQVQTHFTPLYLVNELAIYSIQAELICSNIYLKRLEVTGNNKGKWLFDDLNCLSIAMDGANNMQCEMRFQSLNSKIMMFENEHENKFWKIYSEYIKECKETVFSIDSFKFEKLEFANSYLSFYNQCQLSGASLDRLKYYSTQPFSIDAIWQSKTTTYGKRELNSFQEIFRQLKCIEIANNNRPQELIYKAEEMKAYRMQVAQYEKNKYDRFILWTRSLSNFGLSWEKALAWFLVFNSIHLALQAVLSWWQNDWVWSLGGWTLLGNFFISFNVLQNLELYSGMWLLPGMQYGVAGENIMKILYAIRGVVYAFFIYEIVAAFRKFGKE